MKFSLNNIHASANWHPRYLWAVHFMDNKPNIQNSSLPDANLVIPCTSVTEVLYEHEIETVSTINGLKLPMPLNVWYLGTVGINFYDSGHPGQIQTIQNWFINWVDNIHSDTNAFKPLKSDDVTKWMYVKKYDRESEGYIWQSMYKVLPPTNLNFQGSMDVTAREEDVVLTIMQVQKLQQK